ncbi:DNA replication and repair protein RecF [Patescibacteria group bacterium]|nr:DNA replication and repair protein RecF [Patescibacteria group bacterium]
MQITKLELINYRNHKNLSMEFAENTTLIIGGNGSGKTNIIEAINMLSTGKGFKASFDREVINYKEKSSTIKGNITRETNDDTLKKEIKMGILIQKDQDESNKSIKTAKINGKPLKIGNLSNSFNTVLFSPLEMNLLVNGPSKRRDFLDTILFQRDDAYKKDLSNFTKVRRQRNKILETLREKGSGYAQLKFWNEKLIQHGKSLQEKRKQFFEYINDHINDVIKKIDPNIETKVKYLINPALEEKLVLYQQKEIFAGATLVGPHRDDFIFTSKEYGETQDFSKFASRGQQRTLILALKLCELSYLEQRIGEKPVLLLDDIFSELDEKHQMALKNVIGEQQTIITSASENTSQLGKNIYIHRL